MRLNILLILQDQENDVCYVWIIMETRVFFVNATKIYQLKAKDSGLKPNILCLGNISNDFTANNMKKGLNCYVYDFFVDSNVIDANDIINIHKYLV